MFQENHRALLSYALRRVSDPADAADVIAETFTTAWRRIEDVPDGARARLWLFGVARRVLANHHRSQRRRDALADRLRDTLAEVVVREPADSGLAQALVRLRDDDRELLRLLAWEQLTQEEIAVVLGLSRPAVRVRLHRARRRLRALLDDLDQPERVSEPSALKRLPPTGHELSEAVAAAHDTGEHR